MVERVTLAAQLDPYLTLKGLSGYSSISVRQLRNLINDPVRPLPHFRIGGRVLVRRSDFDLWAAQHRREGVSLEERIDRLRARERRKLGPAQAAWGRWPRARAR